MEYNTSGIVLCVKPIFVLKFTHHSNLIGIISSEITTNLMQICNLIDLLTSNNYFIIANIVKSSACIVFSLLCKLNKVFLAFYYIFIESFALRVIT